MGRKLAPEERCFPPADLEKEVHGNGVPFSITRVKRDEMCQLVAEGLSLNRAAAYSGIGYHTLQEWLWKGGYPRLKSKKAILPEYCVEPYISFVQAILEAEARLEKTHVDNVTKAGASDWKASAWVLQRKFPDEYGEPAKATVDVNTAGDGQVSVNLYLPQKGEPVPEETDADDGDGRDV